MFESVTTISYTCRNSSWWQIPSCHPFQSSHTICVWLIFVCDIRTDAMGWPESRRNGRCRMKILSRWKSVLHSVPNKFGAFFCWTYQIEHFLCASTHIFHPLILATSARSRTLGNLCTRFLLLPTNALLTAAISCTERPRTMAYYWNCSLINELSDWIESV